MTLTLARVEVNEFWGKILKALNLRISNPVPELIYLDPNSRYDHFTPKFLLSKKVSFAMFGL